MYDTVCRLVTWPERKENYELFILGMHVDFISFCNLVYFAMGVKWTMLTFKELAAQRTLRMDAKYWIKKKEKATSSKPQASSGKQRLTCKYK